jgi:hypothetical protein
MTEDLLEIETTKIGTAMTTEKYAQQPAMTKDQELELEYRELNLEYGDDMSEVTLCTYESSNLSDKDPSSPPSKWGLLWKTKSPKKIKKTMKKKMKREVRDSPEGEDTFVNEKKGWGWPSKSKEKFYEGVVEEEQEGHEDRVHHRQLAETIEEAEEEDTFFNENKGWGLPSKSKKQFVEEEPEGPEDEVPLRQPAETIEDAPGLLADLNEKFCRKEHVDEYKLCRLELQERSRVGHGLNAEEVYEMELLLRHAVGEELFEESNDLDHFVEKRLMYKILQLDLEVLRGQQQQGENIDQDLLFVLELFERRRLQVPMDIMEKLALDLLERDRLDENLDDGEMEELLDIMDMLKSKKAPSHPVEKEARSSLMTGEEEAPIISHEHLGRKDPKSAAANTETSKGWGVPWGSEGTQLEACLAMESNDEAKDRKETHAAENDAAVSRRGWLSYWRSNQQCQAAKARDDIQKQLLDKSLLKAKLLMEIDNLKMDLKKANTSVLQLGGERDETTRGLPPDEMAPEGHESTLSAESECKDLEIAIQEKDGQIAALEAKVRALRANNVTSVRKDGRSQTSDATVSTQESSSISSMLKLSVECEHLKQQLTEINQKYAESHSSHQSACWKMKGVETELEQTQHDLQAAKTELDQQEGKLQLSSNGYEALNERYDAAVSKITKMEEDYPAEMRRRVTEVLEGMGKTGGVEVLIDCYQSAEASIESLEVELTSAKQEAAAANMRQVEYCNAVAMCKKLEEEAVDLRLKLQDAEKQASGAKKEAGRSMEEEVAESRLQMTEQAKKLEALSQQVQFFDEENGKLMEENIELKELCEEMISGMGAETLDC